jgi:hypothetical protein
MHCAHRTEHTGDTEKKEHICLSLFDFLLGVLSVFGGLSLFDPSFAFENYGQRSCALRDFFFCCNGAGLGCAPSSSG